MPNEKPSFIAKAFQEIKPIIIETDGNTRENEFSQPCQYTWSFDSKLYFCGVECIVLYVNVCVCVCLYMCETLSEMSS